MPAYVFATFRDGEWRNRRPALGDGLRLLLSRDGDEWQAVPPDQSVVLRPPFGAVFRDPSITWHDGYFHMCFTTELCAGVDSVSRRGDGWRCDWHRARAAVPPRFGYARSRDLLHWDDVRAVPVVLPGACNVYAPEWHPLTDAEAARSGGHTMMVVFSSQIVNDRRCPDGFAGQTSQEALYVTTRDFASFSSPKRLFRLERSVIDTFLFRSSAREWHGPEGAPQVTRTYAVYKSEQGSLSPENAAPRRRALRGVAGPPPHRLELARRFGRLLQAGRSRPLPAVRRLQSAAVGHGDRRRRILGPVELGGGGGFAPPRGAALQAWHPHQTAAGGAVQHMSLASRGNGCRRAAPVVVRTQRDVRGGSPAG